LNNAAGVRQFSSISLSLTLRTLDAMPYFPQQKELQHTITKFIQSFSADVETKHTRRREWPANYK